MAHNNTTPVRSGGDQWWLWAILAIAVALLLFAIMGCDSVRAPEVSIKSQTELAHPADLRLGANTTATLTAPLPIQTEKGPATIPAGTPVEVPRGTPVKAPAGTVIDSGWDALAATAAWFVVVGGFLVGLTAAGIALWRWWKAPESSDSTPEPTTPPAGS